jgi:peptidoglycan/LPS O-acetylase OafA/YrhL
MQYRAEIDGLRAVAVVAVILFHAGVRSLDGGFTGVDVFFVISGYLITSLIAEGLDKGEFRLLAFYERRARRILPALFLVVGVSIPVALFILLPHNLDEFAKSAVATAVFASNIFFWSQQDYFSIDAAVKPLLHTWSLAVEEQYYVLFPFVLVAAWPWGRRIVFALIGGLTAISLLIASWAAHNHPFAGFFLLPARGWEILVGATVALIIRTDPLEKRVSRSTAQALGIAGLVLVALPVFLFDRNTADPVLLALPVCGTVLLIVFARDGTLSHAVLSYRPLVAIGLISYSAYLWHQPIFAFARSWLLVEPPPALMALLGLGTFVLAYASWQLVERPFRNRRAISGRAIFLLSVGGSLTCVALGLTGHFAQGFPNRQARLKDYQPDNYALDVESWSILCDLSRDPGYGYKANQNAFDDELWYDLRDPRRRLLVVGNSHSKDVFNTLYFSDQARSHYQIARYGIHLNGILAKDSKLFNAPNYQAADSIMLATRYQERDLPALASVIRRIIRRIIGDGKRPILVTNVFETRRYYDAILADLMLRQLRGQYDLVNNGEKVAALINRRFYLDYADALAAGGEIFQINDIIKKIGHELAVPVLDRMDYVCNSSEQSCYAIDEDYRKYFYDTNHQSLAGDRFFAGRLDAIHWLSPLIE